MAVAVNAALTLAEATSAQFAAVFAAHDPALEADIAAAAQGPALVADLIAFGWTPPAYPGPRRRPRFRRRPPQLLPANPRLRGTAPMLTSPHHLRDHSRSRRVCVAELQREPTMTARRDLVVIARDIAKHLLVHTGDVTPESTTWTLFALADELEDQRGRSAASKRTDEGHRLLTGQAKSSDLICPPAPTAEAPSEVRAWVAVKRSPDSPLATGVEFEFTARVIPAEDTAEQKHFQSMGFELLPLAAHGSHTGWVTP